MVKRISCRVVRSVPFKRSGDVSQSSRHDTDCSWDRSVDAAEVGFKSSSNSSGYTFRANGAMAAFGESVAGLVLDCLA